MTAEGLRAPRWTDDEVKTLARHYREHGPDWDGWADLLPGRNSNAIRSMAARHGLESNAIRDLRYTDDETRALRMLYPLHGAAWEGWADVLPGRTQGSISSMAIKLGLRAPGSRWTTSDDAVVELYYSTRGEHWGGWAEVLPSRTYKSISLRARRLGVKKLRMGEQGESLATSGKWTREQDVYLLHQLAAIARRTGHNAYEVVERANEMQREVAANG